MMEKVLITGVTGQDGSYLAEELLRSNYQVDGLVRRSSTPSYERIEHLRGNKHFALIEGDVTDSGCIHALIQHRQYDYIYHLAAMSHVGTSYKQPTYTFDVNCGGTLHILEAVRTLSPHTRVYVAGTSEEFGNSGREQDENTRLDPVSPYAASKVAARHLVRIYRDSYGVFASMNWLFNHESPRRGENFVTRKITKWIANTHRTIDGNWDALQEFDAEHLFYHDIKIPKLRLGNINTYRDWGYAPDYVQAMIKTLYHDQPDEFVIATGNTYCVADFLRAAFDVVDAGHYGAYIFIDPQFYRPSDVHRLCGDASKAHDVLGWYPEVSFYDLVSLMVWSDINGKEVYPQSYQEKYAASKLQRSGVQEVAKGGQAS